MRFLSTRTTGLFQRLAGVLAVVAVAIGLISSSSQYAVAEISGRTFADLGAVRAGTVNAAGQVCHKMLVLRVVDGDTVYGYIDTSDPLIALRARLRLAGINAPEKGRRARCPAEKSRAAKAEQYVQQLLAPAIEKRTRQLVRACNIKRGKYALRRIASLEVRQRNGWLNVGEQLVKRGLAGRSKRGRRLDWCAIAGRPSSQG